MAANTLRRIFQSWDAVLSVAAGATMFTLFVTSERTLLDGKPYLGLPLRLGVHSGLDGSLGRAG